MAVRGIWGGGGGGVEGGGDGEREGKAEEVGLIYEKGLLRRAPALFAWMGGFAVCFWWVYGLIWV